MKIYVNEITGIADAIVSMFMSKRSWIIHGLRAW